MNDLQNLIKKWKKERKELTKQIDLMYQDYSYILGEKNQEFAALVGLRGRLDVCISDLNKVLKEIKK
jgi:hypothetical protein